mmetsp:Transcript_12880/g.24358  ORF Transcript_12880/g.24358 Transcript_12880/m.24358 type:complete len:194 (+) Transcript_12880:125-706(+)
MKTTQGLRPVCGTSWRLCKNPRAVKVVLASRQRSESTSCSERTTVEVRGKNAWKSFGKDGEEAAMPQYVKKVLVAAAAGMLLSTTALPEDSWAARSGGRVGGRAFRSAPRPRAAPRSSSRMGSGGGMYTAPPLVGGYGGGYGYGRGYGFPVFAPPIFFFSPFGSIFQLFLLFVAVSFLFVLLSLRLCFATCLR